MTAYKIILHQLTIRLTVWVLEYDSVRLLASAALFSKRVEVRGAVSRNKVEDESDTVVQTRITRAANIPKTPSTLPTS